MTDNGDYVQALEDECARANAFIGVLRLVASRSEQPVYGGPDYPLYRQYVESRERRLTVLEATENAHSTSPLTSAHSDRTLSS